MQIKLTELTESQQLIQQKNHIQHLYHRIHIIEGGTGSLVFKETMVENLANDISIDAKAE